MRLVPTTDELVDAQNAINAQHPSLSDDAPATTLANDTDGTGRRVLRLTTQQLATIVHALARATFERWTPLDAQIAVALGAIRLERLPDGTVRAADPREAVPQVARLFALVLERREHPELDADVCWHCHDVLTSAPRPHCESCPPDGECDVEGCIAPGCEGHS